MLARTCFARGAIQEGKLKKTVRFSPAVLAGSGAILFFWIAALGAAAAPERSDYATPAVAAVLMESATGAILYQKNADTPLPPASLSKLMTLAVLFKELKAGNVTLDTKLTVSEHAWRTGGAPSRTSAMFVPINTKESVRKLIRGIAVQSGNDASIAIAEGLAGSESAFARLMNEEAKAIGLTGSTFSNPTGLDDPDQLMSARDLAVLSRHLIINYPQYYGYFAEPEFRYRKHRFFNRNPLLSGDYGVDGLKTGHTKKAGYGIALSAEQDGRRLIAVLLGLKTSVKRKIEGQRILRWGFSSLEYARLFDKGEVVGYARVWGGSSFYLPLEVHDDLSIPILQTFETQRFSARIRYASPLKPPIRQGAKVAELELVGASGTEHTVPLYAAADIEPAGTVRQGLDTLAIQLGRFIGL